MDIYNANERIVHSVGRLLEHLSPSLHTLDLNCNGSFNLLTTDLLRVLYLARFLGLPYFADRSYLCV
jgi:hypothetical protein